MTPEVFAAHLLAALPLAGVLGLRLPGRPAGWAVVGLAAGWCGWACWEPANGLLGDFSPPLAARAAVRTGLLAVVLTPWAAVAAGLVPTAARPRPPGLAVATAVLVAACVPAVAASRAATRGLADAERLLSTGRLAAADAALRGVIELTADRTITLNGRPTPMEQVRSELGRRLQALEAEAGQPPADSPAARYERAEVLLALGRPAEVEPLLRDNLSKSPRTRLRLAEALADSADWSGCATQCRAAADALRDRAAGDPRAAAVRRQALDMLADSYAMLDDRPAVENTLRDGVDTLPAFAGHFHLRLGEFYRTTGRPIAALDQLSQAERLDPSLAGRAAAVRRLIREQTPGCLVGR